MKHITKWSLVAALWLFALNGPAALVVQVSPPKSTGSTATVKVELQNTYSEKIRGARAAIFLINDQGKVVGQLAKWIIGGGNDRQPLESNAKTSYNFVVVTDKPFVKTKLIVTRILLDGDKLANLKEVQVQYSAN